MGSDPLVEALLALLTIVIGALFADWKNKFSRLERQMSELVNQLTKMQVADAKFVSQDKHNELAKNIREDLRELGERTARLETERDVLKAEVMILRQARS